MTWVGDDCETLPPVTTSAERARGILTIHKDCDPPCPRKLGALPYLPATSPNPRWMR